MQKRILFELAIHGSLLNFYLFSFIIIIFFYFLQLKPQYAGQWFENPQGDVFFETCEGFSCPKGVRQVVPPVRNSEEKII